MGAALRVILKAILTAVSMFLITWLPSRVLRLLWHPVYPEAIPLWKRIFIGMGNASVSFWYFFLLIALVERGVHWYLYARRPRHRPQDRCWRMRAREAVTTSATACGLFAILGIGTAAIFGGKVEIQTAAGLAVLAASMFGILTPAVLLMRRLTER